MPVDYGWQDANAYHATLIALGRPAQLPHIKAVARGEIPTVS